MSPSVTTLFYGVSLVFIYCNTLFIFKSSILWIGYLLKIGGITQMKIYGVKHDVP
jgi:hypothetical protein